MSSSGDSDSDSDSGPGEQLPDLSSAGWRVTNQISIADNQLSYTGQRRVTLFHEDVGIAIANHRFSYSRKYFELLILVPGVETEIGVGAVRRDYPVNEFPGWDWGSAAYHADNGALYDEDARLRNFSAVGRVQLGICGQGDRMGCGVQFLDDHARLSAEIGGNAGNGEETVVTVFFTKNGEEVGSCQQILPRDGLYPAVGMRSIGSVIQMDMTSFLSVPPLLDICRSFISTSLGCADIQTLPIPANLKRYLAQRSWT